MKEKEKAFREELQYYDPNDLDPECTYSSAGVSGPLFPLLSPEDTHFEEIFERYRPIMRKQVEQLYKGKMNKQAEK